MTPSFSCPLPIESGGGRRPGNLADAPHDCSTSQAFSPRTVLTENICRYVKYKLQHFPTTVPFLTSSTITLSWLASAAPQADSWWLGHVEPDDLVIADIGGQALDILLHGPESAHKNGIVKANIQSYIHSHPPMHTPNTKSKTVNSLNVTPSLRCPPPVQRAGGRRPGSLADAPHDCSTSEAFSPRAVLTENIYRGLQQKLQHFLTTMAFLTASTITLSCLARAAPQDES